LSIRKGSGEKGEVKEEEEEEEEEAEITTFVFRKCVKKVKCVNEKTFFHS
jgi:hypothetical protein